MDIERVCLWNEASLHGLNPSDLVRLHTAGVQESMVDLEQPVESTRDSILVTPAERVWAEGSEE